ncbi:MAG: hypothetical protein HY368_00190 [Candidatus Aenigmarchaeota archaeon]|nr:hypothetical protein [Candidatus Aenigmarchaeota archaeon]
MVSKLTVFAVQVTGLAVLLSLLYFWKGLPLAAITALVWLDKAVLVHAKITPYFGVELLVMPTILAGLHYGAVFGFLYGFVAIPLFGGFIEMLSWIISPPINVDWPPLLPSHHSLSWGLAGLVAGLLGTALPFVIVAAASAAAKNVVEYFLVSVSSDDPVGPSQVLNIIYIVLFAVFVERYFSWLLPA